MMKDKNSQYQNSKILLSQNFLRQIASQKQELHKIRQQQQTIFSIDQNLRKKNQEILRLKTLVDKYEPFYQKYQNLTLQYTQKCSKLNQKQKELSILMKQTDELIKQSQLYQNRFSVCDNQRIRLLKQQHEIEKVNHQIQQTFKMYQEQCKKKQMVLLRDLEKAYKQITQLNKRIDEYEMKVFQNQELRKKLSSKLSQQNRNSSQVSNTVKNFEKTQIQINPLDRRYLVELNQENETLKLLLSNKQDQLTKYKILNHELSIEFDKSVSKICEFERELTKYRQENHQLQKMLNLFVEKQKYQKMHIRQLEKLNARKLDNSLQENSPNNNHINSSNQHQDSEGFIQH